METALPTSRPQGALARAASQAGWSRIPSCPTALSSGPDVKQFAIGVGAGIIIDATLIRALLVPSLRRLFGRWNPWFPEPLGKLLLVRQPKPAAATE
jgi:hypothetical protein